MKKTASQLYEMINKTAIQLMLEDGLSREEAFKLAVPKHFESVAVEEGKLLKVFDELVWVTLNKIQDDLKLEKVGVGRIMIMMQLQGNADRQRVYGALRKLATRGMVYRPNQKTWSRIRKAKQKKGARPAVAAKSAASD
jgi:hypothetical protein